MNCTHQCKMLNMFNLLAFVMSYIRKRKKNFPPHANWVVLLCYCDRPFLRSLPQSTHTCTVWASWCVTSRTVRRWGKPWPPQSTITSSPTSLTSTRSANGGFNKFCSSLCLGVRQSTVSVTGTTDCDVEKMLPLCESVQQSGQWSTCSICCTHAYSLDGLLILLFIFISPLSCGLSGI